MLSNTPKWTEDWSSEDYCWIARKLRVLRAFIIAKGLEDDFMMWKRDKVRLSSEEEADG